MKIRPFEPSDYGDYATWFTGHGWGQAPSLDLLSNTGFLVYDKEGPLCAGFVYYTNSSITLLEWMATNPQRHGIRTVKAIKVLIDHVKLMISQLPGPRYLMGATDNKGLKAHYERYMGATASKPCWVMAWAKGG